MRRANDARVATAVLSLLAIAAAGCFEERDRPTVPVFGSLQVESDPEGAAIFIDDQALGVVTPITLDMVPAGEHLLELILGEGTAEVFSFADSVVVPEEALDSVAGALQGGCFGNCPFLLARGRVDCRFTNGGDTCASVFFDDPALEWPAGSGSDYGAGGRLLVAGVIDSDGGDLAGDTLAIPVYAVGAWIGRRPVARESSTHRQEFGVDYWSRASFAGQYLQGLAVRQTLVSVDSSLVEDVILVRFEITNNSADELYRRLFTWIPEGGFTLRDVYLGFGLDADVGMADDDLGTFDPSLDLAFIYDADFRDAQLPADFRDNPALVGVATIVPPAGAAARTLTFWRQANDWDGGGTAYAFAWRLLSGQLAPDDPLTDHPVAEIGHHPADPGDYRMIDAYGPLTLAPGESTELVIAILLAEPVAGTFTPGTSIAPGNPTNASRPILDVAADLRELASQLPEFWTRYRN